MPSKKEIESAKNNVKNLICSAYVKSEAFNKIKESYEDERAEIYEELWQNMKVLGMKEFEFIGDGLLDKSLTYNPKKFKCKIIEPQSINYDEAAMLEKLDGTLIEALFDKQYEIVNVQDFIKFLKESGIRAKDFKKFVKCKRKLNVARLDKLYETGFVKLEDLKGCYNIIKKKSYWKISAKDCKDNEED